MWMWVLWIASAGLFVAALAVFVHSRRMVRRADQMLADAIDGSFTETSFDESVLSALEAKMARFLNGTAASTRNLAAEKEKIAALIADISHQTKTPIANIALYAALLAESGELSPAQREQAEILQKQANKLSFLIGELVKRSRLETGLLKVHPKEQPVAPLLEAVAAAFAPAAAEKGLSIAVEPTDAVAAYDRKWLSEALGNVLDNAVKYSPAKSTVTLRAAAFTYFCRIDVEDQGPGIPEAEQAAIFTRFHRAPGTEDADGVGLGLYLAREILSAHGGYMKVASKVGEGSTFSLYLLMEHP